MNVKSKVERICDLEAYVDMNGELLYPMQMRLRIQTLGSGKQQSLTMMKILIIVHGKTRQFDGDY